MNRGDVVKINTLSSNFNGYHGIVRDVEAFSTWTRVTVDLPEAPIDRRFLTFAEDELELVPAQEVGG